MTCYAHVDTSEPEPQLVLGWYDTEVMEYTNHLPDKSALLEVPEDVWKVRMQHTGAWRVRGGKLEKAVPVCLRNGKLVPVDIDQVDRQKQAQAYDSLTVDSDDPEIAGTYSIGLIVELGPLARDVGAGFPLPEGETHPVKDVDGKVRQFGKDDLVNLYLALRDLRHHVKAQTEAATPQWPDARVQHQAMQAWRPAWKI